ncbi:MAG: ferrochelatase [Janthinobacterium lividum]
MRFETEPGHTHGTIAKTAVVLVNLGTPDAPTAKAVRPYLKEFLSDQRVVEIPRPIWWLILNLAILPFRSAKSAAKYALIWSADGSPLQVHTTRQAVMLRGFLGERGHQVQVVHAMRYGAPSVASVLDKLRQDGVDRILVLPAYPQYSATTTASIFDAVFGHYARVRNVPELRLIKHYHDHPAYIDALAQSVRAFWSRHGRGDKLLLSFHGVPQRTLTLGDPYHCECHKTARLLATALGLAPQDYLLTFQSRFGRAQWLQPYTLPTVIELAKGGLERIDVICPGFTSDCLETLEEINLEVRAAFLEAGGKQYHYIQCLNESQPWIHALADIVEQQLAGWPTRPTPGDAQHRQDDAAIGRKRALELGARQ